MVKLYPLDFTTLKLKAKWRDGNNMNFMKKMFYSFLGKFESFRNTS